MIANAIVVTTELKESKSMKNKDSEETCLVASKCWRSVKVSSTTSSHSFFENRIVLRNYNSVHIIEYLK